MESKILIVSPHPDDELIACLSVLKKGVTVVYMFGEEQRQIEAVVFGQHFGLNTLFCNDLIELEILLEDKWDEVYIPSYYDINLEHKWISNYVLSIIYDNVILYSYQNLFPPLRNNQIFIENEIDVVDKINLIKKYYPSQYNNLLSSGILNESLGHTEKFLKWSTKK